MLPLGICSLSSEELPHGKHWTKHCAHIISVSMTTWEAGITTPVFNIRKLGRPGRSGSPLMWITHDEAGRGTPHLPQSKPCSWSLSWVNPMEKPALCRAWLPTSASTCLGVEGMGGQWRSGPPRGDKNPCRLMARGQFPIKCSQPQIAFYETLGQTDRKRWQDNKFPVHPRD